MPWFSVLLLPIHQLVLFRPRGNSNLWAWNKKEWNQVRWDKWYNKNNTMNQEPKSTSKHLTLEVNYGAGRENFFSAITFKLYHRHQNLGRFQGQPGGQESSHCNLLNAYVWYKYVYIGGEKMIISFLRVSRNIFIVHSFLASIFSSFFFYF